MAKGKTTAVAKWDAEMAKYAAQSAGIEASLASGNWFSTKGGILAFQGNACAGNAFTGIILDDLFENTYFTEKFDPDNIQMPACYAFGHGLEATVIKLMKPHEKAPQKQHLSCGTAGQAGCCPHNEWESADTGKGKACQNRRRLSWITQADAESADSVEAAQVAYMRIPVTSGKGYSGYKVQLNNGYKRPPFGVVTKIHITQDAKTQFKASFEFVELLKDGSVIEAIMAKREADLATFTAPYPEFGDDDGPKKPSRGKPAPTAKKGVAKKKRY